MRLIGQTSGAQATITNVRLISDLSATLIGSFFIPNPNSNIHPRFETGTKVLTFTNNNLNNQNVATTIAEEAFSSSGTLETVQENIISVRNARVENKQTFEEEQLARTTGTQVVNSTIVSNTKTRNNWLV
jgi:outer membrane protein W